ncbi:MAG: dipeptidase [Acetatifactor sp.]
MKYIDMHCDTVSRLLKLEMEGRGETLRENSGHLDLLRMRQAGCLLQNFALFVELDKDGEPWERVCKLQALYTKELEENADLIAPVYQYSDIAKNRAAGKMSALLTVEEGGVCGGEPEKLHRLYDMGVRMLTLTWNFPNELGSPNFSRELLGKLKKERTQRAYEKYFHTPNVSGGLTERGREFVTEMERLGMIPDVSHLSDKGFYDVLETTVKPFVASHSDARAVCPCVRNLTDDMLRKLAERGGVTGLNFCADFLEEKPLGEKNGGTIESIIRHAKHIVQVGGIEVLGLGSDFDGIDTHEELGDVLGLERLRDALKKAGFTESMLDKIFHENVLRVYRDSLVPKQT